MVNRTDLEPSDTECGEDGRHTGTGQIFSVERKLTSWCLAADLIQAAKASKVAAATTTGRYDSGRFGPARKNDGVQLSDGSPEPMALARGARANGLLKPRRASFLWLQLLRLRRAIPKADRCEVGALSGETID